MPKFVNKKSLNNSRNDLVGNQVLVQDLAQPQDNLKFDIGDYAVQETNEEHGEANLDSYNESKVVLLPSGITHPQNSDMIP